MRYFFLTFNILFLLFLFAFSFPLTAQDYDCYNSTRTKGIQLMQKLDYSKAIEYFKAAEDCPDKPSSNDLRVKREECLRIIREIEEENRRREDLVRKKAQESINASKAYMNIIDIKFANSDYDRNILTDYGEPLFSSEMRYLQPKVFYNGLGQEEKNVTLFWKIIKPDGTLSQSNSSPEGFTSYSDYTIYPRDNKSIELLGWGNKNCSTYPAGTYRYELWYNGNKIYTKNISICDSRGATIEKITVEHGAYQNNVQGMRIHVNFTVAGCKSESCKCIAYFYENGEKMKDTNNSYRASDGQVSIGKDFQPKYENTRYDDFVMFMPISELHTRSTSGEISCYFSIKIYNKDTKSFIGNEKKYYFTITK